MTTWTSGYVADIGYTYGFYRELTPALLSFVALSKGQQGPEVGAGLTYCELGCGQGFSMNVLAAGNPEIQFHATDFNPAQVAGARRLAAEAGLSNINFYDHSFADFAAAPKLPESFDIIALHGIYSWISTENRQAIIDFIDKKAEGRGAGLYLLQCPSWLGFWHAPAPPFCGSGGPGRGPDWAARREGSQLC